VTDLVIVTEDGGEVREGDVVWCYYDGYWARIVEIRDQFSSLRDDPDSSEYTTANPNQDYWADVVEVGTDRKGYYNGQRMATYDPNGTTPPKES
jgi:hypothetical protein